MNLKLAEYNLETGKFERFLELGKDFLYCGDSVILCGCSIETLIEYMDPIFIKDYFKKDEKDPLNRFNGLFDGRTYGEGRFVLIESKIISRFDNPLLMSQDDIFSYNEYIQKACDFINFHHWEETEEQVEINPNFKILGNLHENPELYEKAKYINT